MPLEISQYVDPDVYIGEINTPTQINPASQPEVVCLVSPGLRTKGVPNAPVRRGLIRGEALTVSATAPHVATLPRRGTRRKETTRLFRDGRFLRDTQFSYPAPVLTSTVDLPVTVTSGELNLSVPRSLAVSLDGLPFVTIELDDDATGIAINASSISGGRMSITTATPHGLALGDYLTTDSLATDVDVAAQVVEVTSATVVVVETSASDIGSNMGSGGETLFPVAATASAGGAYVTVTGEFQGGSGYDRSVLVAALNSALRAAPEYGEDYFSAFSASGAPGPLRITSPLSNPAADVLLRPSPSSASDALSDLFGDVREAAHQIEVAGPAYRATSSYRVDYVAEGSITDPLDSVNPVEEVQQVGSESGLADFVEEQDWLAVEIIDSGRAVDSEGVLIGGGGTSVSKTGVATGVAVGDYFVNETMGEWAIITGLPDANTLTLGSALTVRTSEQDYRIFRPGVGDGAANDAIAWLYQAPASIAGVPPDGTFDLTNSAAAPSFDLAMDGRPLVTVDLNLTAPSTELQQLGYATPGTPAAATPAEVAANINAVLANDQDYGAAYAGVATVSGNSVILTSPVRGVSSSIVLTRDATSTLSEAVIQDIFGIAPAGLPSIQSGSGASPAEDIQYFASYVITRPESDYNRVRQFFAADAALADLGEPSPDNILGFYVGRLFEMGLGTLTVVQVDDRTTPGVPLRSEWQAAFDATSNTDLMTIMVANTTDLAIQTDLRNFIEKQSGPVARHPRQGYFGMPVGTNPGDRDTPGTFVHLATQTLQVPPDSPGRGRFWVWTGPQRNNITVDIVRPDNTGIDTVRFDSVYWAVIAAGTRALFPSPHLSIATRNLDNNANQADISRPWTPAERAQMASNGVAVVTFDAGNFVCLDPVSTEAGQGGAAKFTYDNTAPQKDNITRKVTRAVASNVIGIVPTSFADFIIDVKAIIASVLETEVSRGAIGPFRDAAGNNRAINLATDIAVRFDPADPSRFFFSYNYFLRYPALRGFGNFVVDNPFFAASDTL